MTIDKVTEQNWDPEHPLLTQELKINLLIIELGEHFKRGAQRVAWCKGGEDNTHLTVDTVIASHFLLVDYRGLCRVPALPDISITT